MKFWEIWKHQFGYKHNLYEDKKIVSFWFFLEFDIKVYHIILKLYSKALVKGQLISKCLLVDFNFFQKLNKNTSHSSKNEFIRSFLEKFTAWQFGFEINWPSPPT